MPEFRLSPHPFDGPPPAVRLRAAVDPNDHGLDAHFWLEGDLECLQLAKPRPPQRAQNLWQTTCFEIFLAASTARHYYEYNIAPSSLWDCIRFIDRRQRCGSSRPAPPPRVAVSRRETCLTAAARIDLPDDIGGDPASILVGISAILEDVSGRQSHWAHRHSAGLPDFHDRRNFLLLPQICEDV